MNIFINLIISIFMAVFAIVFFALYFIIGNMIWIVVLFRINFMYALSLIWDKTKSNEFRDMAQDYSKKHFQMFGEILKLPLYVWKDLDADDKENRNMIREVLSAEWQILNKNWEINFVILISMIFSFFKLLTFVGLLNFHSAQEILIPEKFNLSETVRTVEVEKIVYPNKNELDIAKGTTRIILVLLFFLIIYFVLSWFETGEDFATIIGLGISALLLIFLLYDCYIYFENHSIFQILF